MNIRTIIRLIESSSPINIQDATEDSLVNHDDHHDDKEEFQTMDERTAALYARMRKNLMYNIGKLQDTMNQASVVFHNSNGSIGDCLDFSKKIIKYRDMAMRSEDRMNALEDEFGLERTEAQIFNLTDDLTIALNEFISCFGQIQDETASRATMMAAMRARAS